MNVRDLLAGFLGIALSIFICIESRESGVGTIHSPGPGFLPFWSAIVLGALGIILVVTAAKGKSGRADLSDLWHRLQERRIFVVIVSLFLYAVFLPWLGYIIATFLLLSLLFNVIRAPRHWTMILGALVTTLVTYAVFYMWLDVQFPRGILGF